jgi:uncharacterized protein (DUF302 family)
MSVDMPLRISVIAERGKTVFVYRDVHPLLSTFSGHNVEELTNLINNLLQKIIDQAVERCRANKL